MTQDSSDPPAATTQIPAVPRRRRGADRRQREFVPVPDLMNRRWMQADPSVHPLRYDRALVHGTVAVLVVIAALAIVGHRARAVAIFWLSGLRTEATPAGLGTSFVQRDLTGAEAYDYLVSCDIRPACEARATRLCGGAYVEAEPRHYVQAADARNRLDQHLGVTCL